MLDRAARYLQSAQHAPGRSLSNSIYRRRLLHSAFWHHGANDLDLPAWYFHTVEAIFEPERLPVRDNGLGAGGPNHGQPDPYHALFLDCLYPQKARELLVYVPSLSLASWQKRVRRWTLDVTYQRVGSVLRKVQGYKSGVKSRRVAFSTSTISRNGGVEDVTLPPQVQADSLRILDSLLQAHERGEYTGSWKDAWDLFGRLSEEAKTVQLTRRLISFLAPSTRALDSRRAVRLFKTLPDSERTPWLYSTVIQALIQIQDYGRAVYLHDEALQSNISIAALECSRVLLGHLMSQSHWQLVFHVYNTALLSLEGDTEVLATWTTALFKLLSDMPRAAAIIFDFLAMLAERPSLLEGVGGHWETFIGSLLDALVDRGYHFGTRKNIRVLEIIRSIGLQRRKLYERLAMLTIESVHVTAVSRKDSAIKIYDLYSTEKFFKPSKHLLRTLLDQAEKCNDRNSLQRILPDWYRFHGLPPTSLIGLLLKDRSKQADVAGIQDLLSTHEISVTSHNMRLVYPLLHAFALRGDPASIEEEFRRLRKGLNLEPDITCWNILLHAHGRTDDLDGVLSTLSRITQSGVKPDSWTYGTVMAVSASRGDVEFCQQILSVSANQQIPRSIVMNECLIQACLNDNRFEKAELLARSLTLQSRARTSTRMWNQILTHCCLGQRPGNLKETLRIARLMQKMHIPFDEYTYAAIMRAYVVKRRTDLARRILHRVLRKRSFYLRAFHYAIIMDGYANELKIEKGMRIHAEMLASGIKPSVSTRLALQRLHLQAGAQKITIDRANHPGVRLDVVEENLEEALTAPDASPIFDRSPQLQSARFSTLNKYPAAYFDTPLFFYSKIRAYNTVKRLIEKFEKTGSTTPLRFIVLLMDFRYRGGDHSEVDNYWNLAKDAGLKAVKTAAYSPEQTYIPAVRRTILARHLDIVLRSLHARRMAPGERKLLEVINELFSLGFDLDNGNWNLYVQLTAAGGNYLSAFTSCERHLVTTLPDWREQEPRAQYFQVTGQKSPGSEYLGPRYTYLKPGELRATFKTLVRLALVLRKLRRLAPFDSNAGRQLAELERAAPRTVSAVLEMPMKEHPIATHMLGRRAQRGTRRQLNT